MILLIHVATMQCLNYTVQEQKTSLVVYFLDTHVTLKQCPDYHSWKVFVKPSNHLHWTHAQGEREKMVLFMIKLM